MTQPAIPMLSEPGQIRVGRNACWTNLRFTLLFLLALLCAGCPEPPIATRTVLLRFPELDAQSKVSLSVNDTEVQEALKLIDSVLASDAFVREQHPEMATKEGFVASYAKFTDDGLRLFVFPVVYLKGNQLEFIISEGRSPGGHLSPASDKSLKLVRTELSKRFGSKRVKVER